MNCKNCQTLISNTTKTGLCRKCYIKEYRKTEKYKLYVKKYNNSNQGKLAMKKYRNTEKYKLYLKKYRKTEKFKLYQKKYRKTEKCKMIQKKYSKTEKFKSAQSKYRLTRNARIPELVEDFFKHFFNRIKNEKELLKTVHDYSVTACELSNKHQCELEEQILIKIKNDGGE